MWAFSPKGERRKERRFGLLHGEGFLGLKGTQGQDLPQDLSQG